MYETEKINRGGLNSSFYFRRIPYICNKVINYMIVEKENNFSNMRYCRSCGRVFEDGKTKIEINVNDKDRKDKTDDELILDAMRDPSIVNSIIEKCPFCGSDLGKIEMEDEI